MDPLYADDEVERTPESGERACRDCHHPIPLGSMTCPDCACLFPHGRPRAALPIGIAALVLTVLGMLAL